SPSRGETGTMLDLTYSPTGCAVSEKGADGGGVRARRIAPNRPEPQCPAVAPPPLALRSMRSLRPVVALALVAVAACTAGPAGTTITNVRIVDGTGAPAVSGAVRFVGDSIVAIGDVRPAAGDSVIDGGGLTLAPGFIDTHSHHGGGLLETPDALGAVSQGITTIVAGADGSHPY